MGPNFDDKSCSASCGEPFLRRWRWPIIGRARGLGGNLELQWRRRLSIRMVRRIAK